MTSILQSQAEYVQERNAVLILNEGNGQILPGKGLEVVVKSIRRDDAVARRIYNLDNRSEVLSPVSEINSTFRGESHVFRPRIVGHGGKDPEVVVSNRSVSHEGKGWLGLTRCRLPHPGFEPWDMPGQTLVQPPLAVMSEPLEDVLTASHRPNLS